MGLTSQRPLIDIYGEINRKRSSNSDFSSSHLITDVVRAQQVKVSLSVHFPEQFGILCSNEAFHEGIFG